MEFLLQNKIQHKIADLLWVARDQAAVNDICRVFGVDALIVLNMMLASYYDKIDTTDLSEPILKRIKHGT